LILTDVAAGRGQDRQALFVELFARGLARKDDTATLGLRAVWRY
jgi:hypothetical protein